jgi:hypothetical protein
MMLLGAVIFGAMELQERLREWNFALVYQLVESIIKYIFIFTKKSRAKTSFY